MQLDCSRSHWRANMLTVNPTSNRSGSRFDGVTCAVWNKDAGTHMSQCANACPDVREYMSLTIRQCSILHLWSKLNTRKCRKTVITRQYWVRQSPRRLQKTQGQEKRWRVAADHSKTKCTHQRTCAKLSSLNTRSGEPLDGD